MEALQSVLEQFINNYETQRSVYADELKKSADEFSPQAFAGRIEKIMMEKYE